MKLSIPIFSSVFGEEGQRADAFPFLQEFDFMTNFAVCYYLGHSVFLLNDAEIFLKAPLAPIYFYEEKKGAKKPNFFVRNLQKELKKNFFCLYFVCIFLQNFVSALKLGQKRVFTVALESLES